MFCLLIFIHPAISLKLSHTYKQKQQNTDCNKLLEEIFVCFCFILKIGKLDCNLHHSLAEEKEKTSHSPPGVDDKIDKVFLLITH